MKENLADVCFISTACKAKTTEKNNFNKQICIAATDYMYKDVGHLKITVMFIRLTSLVSLNSKEKLN